MAAFPSPARRKSMSLVRVRTTVRSSAALGSAATSRRACAPNSASTSAISRRSAGRRAIALRRRTAGPLDGGGLPTTDTNTYLADRQDTTTLASHTLMANLYYDVKTGTRFTPYVGAGAGVAFGQMKRVVLRERKLRFYDEFGSRRLADRRILRSDRSPACLALLARRRQRHFGAARRRKRASTPGVRPWH